MAPNNISDEGNSLVVHHWLGLHVFTAKGVGSIPGWETAILQAAQHGGKKKPTDEFQPPGLLSMRFV